ncbi:MAG: hypothetical protein ACOYJ5_04490 [Acutalibacteraceae bacterium]|jgi:hypothetical protein
MDDISAAIRSVLNDPQSMAQIQNIMQSLGANDAGQSGSQNAPGPAPAQNAPNGAGNALQSLLPALGGANDNPMMTMLLRAAPLLASANQEDDATRLLAALRPLLGEARRKKLDEAVRILKLLHLLPLLRESGILQNIF